MQLWQSIIYISLQHFNCPAFFIFLPMYPFFGSVCISYFYYKTNLPDCFTFTSFQFAKPNVSCLMDFVRMHIVVLNRISANTTENYKLMSAGKLLSRKYRLQQKHKVKPVQKKKRQRNKAEKA